MGILIIFEIALLGAACWGIMHEDRLIALERYYARKIRRKSR